jgi:hypothetical protein
MNTCICGHGYTFHSDSDGCCEVDDCNCGYYEEEESEEDEK